MKRLFTLFFILYSLVAYSQDVLLEQNVDNLEAKPLYGPNLRHYVHGYIGLGFPVATSSDQNFIKPVASADFNFGLRYKRRFTNFLAMGFDLGVTSTAYKIKQEDSKKVPDAQVNDKEKIQVNALMGDVWFRINVGRRGNYIGNYLDIGAYGGWNFMKKHKTINTNADDEKVKVSTTRLSYVEDISYGFMARMGTNRYALTARYRSSDIFVTGYDLPELPRLVIGVELGLFK
jgi:Outer membrane protein beta-barrel domain